MSSWQPMAVNKQTFNSAKLLWCHLLEKIDIRKQNVPNYETAKTSLAPQQRAPSPTSRCIFSAQFSHRYKNLPDECFGQNVFSLAFPIPTIYFLQQLKIIKWLKFNQNLLECVSVLLCLNDAVSLGSSTSSGSYHLKLGGQGDEKDLGRVGEAENTIKTYCGKTLKNKKNKNLEKNASVYLHYSQLLINLSSDS